MTTEVARSPGRRRLIRVLLLVALLLIVFPVRRAWQLAADPRAPKDCGSIDEQSSQAIRPAPAADEDTLRWHQRHGTLNDASCLSRTPVYGVVDIRSIDDIRKALGFARRHGLRVSVAAVRHSMGGQALARGGVVLDMRGFNKMEVDAERKVLRVESGATWHDIQNLLHSKKLAVKAMQSTDIFSVGGSISVNAHGMDHRAGSVGSTVRSMRVMRADGSIQNVSRVENPELFHLVVGGYGLFGVILDVELDVTDNVVYQSERRVIRYRDFVDTLTREIMPDTAVGLTYGHLSTSPGSFLDEMMLYLYRRVDVADADIPPLGEVAQTKLRRLAFNVGKQGSWGRRVKWLAERHLEPLMESCPVPRTAAMGDGEACLVSRNHPMHDSVAYLQNDLADETDILHEYFIPQERFVSFVDRLRELTQQHNILLLNASVRIVHKETNILSYAPADNMLAIVLYVNQRISAEGNQRMAGFTSALIDACSDHGGRFFLPYQLHYTAAQLARAYPQIHEFFAAKRRLDPDGLFGNSWFEKYGGA